MLAKKLQKQCWFGPGYYSYEMLGTEKRLIYLGETLEQAKENQTSMGLEVEPALISGSQIADFEASISSYQKILENFQLGRKDKS